MLWVCTRFRFQAHELHQSAAVDVAISELCLQILSSRNSMTANTDIVPSVYAVAMLVYISSVAGATVAAGCVEQRLGQLSAAGAGFGERQLWDIVLVRLHAAEIRKSFLVSHISRNY